MPFRRFIGDNTSVRAHCHLTGETHLSQSLSRPILHSGATFSGLFWSVDPVKAKGWILLILIEGGDWIA